MALRYVDPTRSPTLVARSFNAFGRSRLGQAFGKRVVTKTDIWLGRISSGRLSWGMFNVPSAALRTRGAKSGEPREVQLAYFHDGVDVIVIASNFGGPKHPAWFYNLLANPECTLGGEAFTAQQVTDDVEYARIYGIAERYFGVFADYRAKTELIGRTIPIMRLIPSRT